MAPPHLKSASTLLCEMRTFNPYNIAECKCDKSLRFLEKVIIAYQILVIIPIIYCDAFLVTRHWSKIYNG